MSEDNWVLVGARSRSRSPGSVKSGDAPPSSGGDEKDDKRDFKQDGTNENFTSTNEAGGEGDSGETVDSKEVIGEEVDAPGGSARGGGSDEDGGTKSARAPDDDDVANPPGEEGTGNDADAVTERPCRPRERTLAEARRLVEHSHDGSHDGTAETCVGPDQQLDSAILVANKAREKAIIVMGSGGQCSFVTKKGGCLVVAKGTVQLLQQSNKVRHYTAPTQYIRVDGVITLTNVGVNDAMVTYDMRPHAVADRTIECFHCSERDDLPTACRRIVYGLCCRILEYQGKYYVMDGEGELFEFGDLESSTHQVRALMNDALDTLADQETVEVKRWRLRLLDKEDEERASAFFDIDLDADCECILKKLKAFRGASQTKPQIRFVSRHQLIE